MPSCSFKQLKTSRFIRVLILSGIEPPTQPVVFVEIQGKVIFSEPYGINKEQSINKEFKEVHSKDTELLNSLLVFFKVCHQTLYSFCLLPIVLHMGFTEQMIIIPPDRRGVNMD